MHTLLKAFSEYLENENEEVKVTKPQTAQEWLDAAPAEVRNTFQHAASLEAGEKQRIIDRLTANVKDEKLVEHLGTKSLDDLRTLLILAPPEREPAATSYAGASTGVSANQKLQLTEMGLPNEYIGVQ